jgi:heat shock protein HslJ
MKTDMKQPSMEIDLERPAGRHVPMIARSLMLILLLGLVLPACTPATTPAPAPPTAPVQPTPAVDTSSGQIPLESTNWVLQSYGDPNNPTPVEEGTSITALFSPAKSLTGSSGCNTYSARYAIQGNTMRVDQPIATYLSCSKGMEQEGVYLSALVSVTTYKITGSSLEIVYAKGQGLLKYIATTAP